MTQQNKTWLEAIKWDDNGLIPVITQEFGSNDVLMFAYMNHEALMRTVQLGQAVYWSRSRKKLWHKGEESGNFQQVHEIRLDCDSDVILLKVTQLGRESNETSIACHTGRHSCFYQILKDERWEEVDPVLQDPQTMYRNPSHS